MKDFYCLIFLLGAPKVYFKLTCLPLLSLVIFFLRSTLFFLSFLLLSSLLFSLLSSPLVFFPLLFFSLHSSTPISSTNFRINQWLCQWLTLSPISLICIQDSIAPHSSIRTELLTLLRTMHRMQPMTSMHSHSS